MQVSRQVCPAALVLPWEVVVCGIEIGDQRPLELCAQYPLGYCSPSGVVVLVVALTRRCGEKPHIAVLTFFSPHRLVSMYDAALSDALMHLLLCLLHNRSFGYSMQQLHNFTCGDEQVVHT